MSDIKRVQTKLFGIDVIQSDLFPFKSTKRIQYRFPKSKKKRIRKKWSKREENYKTIEKEILGVMINKSMMNIINELYSIPNDRAILNDMCVLSGKAIESLQLENIKKLN